jgi:hypothetical protein
MKKLYALLFLIMSSLSFGQTFYSENVGTATGTLAISANAFQNSAPIVYSGDADTRSSAASTTYTGASGGRNVFFAAVGGRFFQIDGLNSSAYSSADLQLSFGYLTTTVAAQMVVEYSTDGTTWNPLSFTNNTNANWNLITIGGGVIPSSSTLSLKFTAPATGSGMRIDDIKLSSVSASCTLALGTPTTACNASTLGIDTYNVTIPYTGGGSATYVITPNSGTVGGDNPSTVASGNIVITGVTEGTNFSATITGGTCNLSSTALTPECEPINTLPYYESFSYAEGTALGNSQMWTNANSGDLVTVVAGSLTYPNYSSAGNSISFGGDGSEALSPFTPTNSGTIYSSFLINVTDLTAVTSTAGTYFASLNGLTVADYRARLFVKKDGTQYSLGLDGASTTTNYETTLRNTGDVVMVILGYDFATNTINAWFNPNLTTFTAATTPSLTSTPTAPITELASFVLRQDANNSTPVITFDELKIATTTTELLSVKQNTIAGLKLYPNPVGNGRLFIETTANAEKTVTVFDMLGKQVLNTISSENEINVSELNAGIYVVKITEEGKTATRKLVIK